MNGLCVLLCTGRWSHDEHLQCFGQPRCDLIVTVSQFQVDVDARWCGRTAAQLMIKMIFSEINLLLLTPSMTLIKSLTTGSSTETVEKSSLRSLCCRVEPASASDRRVNVTVLSVTLYLFFYSGDAQSSVTPRPRYVTSHRLIGHKCWEITISQQVDGFLPFFLKIKSHLMFGMHIINNICYNCWEILKYLINNCHLLKRFLCLVEYKD